MNIVVQILLMALGFLCLVKGSDWFVDGAAGIAAKFKIPQIIIGLTIVAMGTSAPELAVSLTAAVEDHASIALGNVVGSNILNILIILGLCALLVNVRVSIDTMRREMPFMIGITVLLLAFGWFGGKLILWEGILFLLLFAMYLGYLFLVARKSDEDEAGNGGKDPCWLLLLKLVAGLGIIVWGSQLTVDSASWLASAVGVSDSFIALTIVALGTSLPELFTSVVAARKGNADIAIGNIIGSNIFNILFILGATAVVAPIAFPVSFCIDVIVAILAGVLLLIAVWKNRELRRPWGIVMLVAYALYFVYLLK